MLTQVCIDTHQLGWHCRCGKTGAAQTDAGKEGEHHHIQQQYLEQNQKQPRRLRVAVKTPT
jgi:hypothetical protein